MHHKVKLKRSFRLRDKGSRRVPASTRYPIYYETTRNPWTKIKRGILRGKKRGTKEQERGTAKRNAIKEDIQRNKQTYKNNFQETIYFR